jgi:Rrf2 family protein
MRFSSTFRYGLRALSILAENYGKNPVSAKEISTVEEISPSFLEQLLANLRKHGVVSGTRGPGGGFKLAKPPREILISDVVEALEGPFYISSCLSDPDSENYCEKFGSCSVVSILKKLESDINSVLSSYSLSDLDAFKDITNLYEDQTR